MRVKPSIFSDLLDTIEKSGGRVMESELLEKLRNRNIDITGHELKKLLMKLEIHDKIRVLSLDAERRVVELKREA